MRKRTAFAAFERWEEVTRDRVAQRRRVRGVMARLAKRAMAHGFARWVEATDEMKRQKVIVRRVLAKIAERVKAGFFYDWHGKVVAKREHLLAEQKEWQKNIKKVERFVL